MKTKYTRKQIIEAINYWNKQIRLGNYRVLNESSAYEAHICNNLAKIIEHQSLDVTVFQKDGHPKTIGKSMEKYEWKYYNVFHSGNYKGASDIYINLPVPEEKLKDPNFSINDVKFVGIEVKERDDSKIFNPQLSFDGDEIAFSNEFLTPGTEQYEEFVDMLIEKFPRRFDLNREIKAIIELFNGLGINVDGFPWNFRKSGFSSQLDVLENLAYNYIDSINGIISSEQKNDTSAHDFFIIAKNAFKNSGQSWYPTNAAIKIDNKLSFDYEDLLRQLFMLMTGRTKRIILSSYDIQGNSVVKSYFNTMRSSNSMYMPVQYIHFNDSLYRLVDDNSKQCRFFTDGKYSVLPYDSMYNGVHVTWYIDFSEKPSDKFIRIRGTITSKQNNGRQASLSDISRAPEVDISLKS